MVSMDEVAAGSVERWLDGTLDAAEATALEALLKDPVMREDVRTQVFLQCLTTEALRPEAAVSAAWNVCRDTLSVSRQVQAATVLRRRIDRPRRLAMWVCASAALIMAGIAVGWAVWPSPQLVQVLAAGDQALAPSELIDARAQPAVLRWRDGSRVELATGSRAVAAPDPAHRLGLLSGLLHAEVAHQQQPFVIALPHGEAAVLGTAFTVAVESTGSWLGVRSGRVALRGPGGEVTVPAGASASVYDHRPSLLTTWPDHRPIVTWTLANVRTMPGNPRGWFDDQTLDVRGAAGQAEFRARMLAETDRLVSSARRHDVQGVIVWDIEGNGGQVPTYPGDPRLLAELAPEMHAVADEVFARFTTAGLRCGVRLGLHPWRRLPDGRRELAADDSAMVTELVARAQVARQRWGCTLFMLGHNLTSAGLAAYGTAEVDEPRHACPAGVVAAVRRAHPDCLFIAEYAAPATWAETAVLVSTDAASISRWRQAQELWPGTQAALLLGNQSIDSPIATAVRAAGGVILRYSTSLADDR
jgi:ferric-dicitrate binding protein FerR (iron transport regulator)